MNRFDLLLLLWVAVGLAGGTPIEGRRAARRARVDVTHPELEMELSAVPAAAPVTPPGVPVHPARPAGPTAVPRGRIVRESVAPLSSCIPGEPAALPASSRAPPVLG